MPRLPDDHPIDAWPRASRDPIARTIALLSLSFALVALCRPIWNIDLFWHIAAGAQFVSRGGLVETDIFSSIEPERRWITFQWGYQVLVHYLDELGGLELLRYAHAVVTFIALLLLGKALLKKLSWSEAGCCALVLLMLVLFGDRIRARPHVFNLLGWCLALPWLARGPTHLRTYSALGMAGLMAFWANLHAGGAFLFLVAAATLPVGETVDQWWRGERRPERLKLTWGWWAAGLLVALCSPHFVQGNVQALLMLEGTESAIGEWLPSWHFLSFISSETLFTSAPAHLICGLAPSAMAFILIGSLLLRAQHGELKEIEGWRLLLLLALLVLAHRSVRFVYISAFALVVAHPLLRLPRSLSSSPRVIALVCSLLLLSASYGFNVSAQRSGLDEAIERALPGAPLELDRYPIRAADFLAGTGFRGGIMCQANWGGYLLWKLGDDVKVSADGRGNYPATLTDDLAYLYDRDNLSDITSGHTRDRILRSYPIDAVVHQRPVWPAGYQPNPVHWSLAYQDNKAEVWVRNTALGTRYMTHLDALRASAPTPAGVTP